MLESIGALKSAVTVLSKHNSFLQTSVATPMQNAMQKHASYRDFHGSLLAWTWSRAFILYILYILYIQLLQKPNYVDKKPSMKTHLSIPYFVANEHGICQAWVTHFEGLGECRRK